jgi:MFS family permease
MTKNQRSKIRKIIYRLLEINALATFSWSMLAPFVVTIGHERNLTIEQAGFVWATYAMTCGIIMIISGKIEDKYADYSQSFQVGLFSMLIGSIVGAIWATSLGLAMSLFCFAAGWGIAIPALKSLYAAHQIKSERAQEWSWMDGGNMLLNGLAAFAAATLVHLYGTQMLFIVMSCIFAVTNLLGIKLRQFLLANS